MGKTLDTEGSATERAAGDAAWLGGCSRACEEERAALHERCAELEAQVEALARLYVASERLLDARGEHEAVIVLREIVIDLLGSEAMAILRADGQAARPVIVFGTGSHATRCPVALAASDRVERALRSGEVGVYAEDEGDGVPRACIPLLHGDSVVGAIVLFELLPQKPSFSPGDLQLMRLLSARGGAALAELGARA